MHLMTNLKRELVNLLEDLSSSLRQTGKIETSDYFSKLVTELVDEEDIADTLERIIQGGAIAQYADFSVNEDLLYSEIHNKARELKNSTN